MEAKLDHRHFVASHLGVQKSSPSRMVATVYDHTALSISVDQRICEFDILYS
jgi:hypothetical protein